MIEFLLGVGAGAVGMYVFREMYPNVLGHSSPHHTGQGLKGRIVPGTVGSPAPGLLLPQSGVASRPDYEWGYVVGPGDTAGDIAEAVTGDDGRYQELLLANPHMPTVGEPGVFLGNNAWDFAPNALVEGQGLLLPVPWSKYIDQTGVPRGRKEPFPADTRALPQGGTTALPGFPGLPPATRGVGGFVPQYSEGQAA